MQQSAVFLVEKQKDFSDQKCIDWQPEKSLSGDDWCRTKQLQNFMAAKLKVNWFLRFASAAGRLISVTGHLIGVKKQYKLCWHVKFSQWKGALYIQEVLELVWTLVYVFRRSMKLFHAVANFATQVNKITFLKFCL